MARIMDRDDPRDMDSFLVITFTKAAASELRSRIMDELGEALAAQPDNRRLRRQSALCQRAEIGTIHAFCQTVLRENCHLAGLSPDFRVADDERAAAMRETALDRVMDERYEHMEKYPASGFWPTPWAPAGTTGAWPRWCWVCTTRCSATPVRKNGRRSR
jgi:ATP-dependent helicase/nuclease subunit A